MIDAKKSLPKVQARLQEIWSRLEAAEDAGDEVTAGIYRRKFADVEAMEAELLSRLRSAG
jgi:hypothetical protein